MDQPILINVYRCTLTSDNDIRHINVIASTFGEAASTCIQSISSWENSDSYELTKVALLDDAFLNFKIFLKYA